VDVLTLELALIELLDSGEQICLGLVLNKAAVTLVG
jgi:hypothetical protein